MPLCTTYGWCKMQVKFLQVSAAGHRESQGLIGCIKEFCCLIAVFAKGMKVAK